MTDDEVAAFWAVAANSARISRLPGYLPPESRSLLVPPAWSFGRTPEQADALLDLVLAGRKTATASDPREYAAEGDPLPEVGTLGIVLDGAGHPRVLLETTAVAIVPFSEVDAEHARLEGEGDLSLAHWRTVHRRFFGLGADEDVPVVLERFRVLHRA